MSPSIFNIYSEHSCRQALGDMDVGILYYGQSINNIRCADNTVVFASSPERVKCLVNILGRSSHEYGLDINTKDKTDGH